MEQIFHSFITAILGCSFKQLLVFVQNKVTRTQMDENGSKGRERELATNGWKREQNFIPLLV
jgi:hypothetical protein